MGIVEKSVEFEKKDKHLQELLLELGVNPSLSGFDILADAVAAWHPGKGIMAIYAYVAHLHGISAAAAERRMRTAVHGAADRDTDAWERVFGRCCSPATGTPTVSEFVARLGRELR